MSFVLAMPSASIGYFKPLSDAAAPSLPFPSPYRILWGKDPFFRSRLLVAILHEALNRRQAVTAIYDPLLPERIVTIGSETWGTVSLPLHRLCGGEELVDCNGLISSESAADLEKAEALAQQQEQLAAEIALAGNLISRQYRLLSGISEKLTDAQLLHAKARRIAKQIPKGDGGESILPLFTREAGKTVHLPLPAVGKTVNLIALQDSYGVATLFLRALSHQLQEKNVQRILLTCALTGEQMGIYLPTNGLCYLKQTSSELPTKKLPLRRYLLSHTTEERRAWRNLAVAVSALEGHLDRLLDAYRNLAKEEDALRASLYNESRLQTFRKRLLIDLFC